MLLQVLLQRVTGSGRRRAVLSVALATLFLVPVLAFAVVSVLAAAPAAAQGDQPPTTAPAATGDPAATTVPAADPAAAVPSSAVPSATPAPSGVATSAGAGGAVRPGEVADAATAAPDLLITVGPGVDPVATIDALIPALTAAPGVAWAAGDTSVQPPQVLVGLRSGDLGDGIDQVRQAMAAQPAATELALTGRAVADDAILGRVRLAAVVAALLAMALVGGLIAWLVGRNEALVAAAATGATALLGGALASKAAGPFDGSVATTALPGVLAAVLMAVYLLFRLLDVSAAPGSGGHPAMVRAAWRSVSIEVGSTLGGLAAVALIMELVSPARPVVTSMLAGAMVAAVVIVPVLPPLVAVLRHPLALPVPPAPTAADAGEQGAAPVEAAVVTAAEIAGDDNDNGDDNGVDEDEDDEDDDEAAAAVVTAAAEPRPLWRTPLGPALPGPDGRQVPLGVLAGLGVVLAVLAILAIRSTSSEPLFDERATGTGIDPAVLVSSGDPTAGIVARFDPGIDQLAKAAWLERISLVPSVARVETATGRYVAGARVDAATVPLAAAGVDRGDEAPELALIVPTVASRSPAAQDLVGDVRVMSGTVSVSLSGAPVDARAAAGRDASSTWVLIVTLALMSAAATFALVGDVRLSAISAGLRLLGSAATVGLYQLLTAVPTGAEIQTTVLLGALAGSLFELGVLRHLAKGPHRGPAESELDDALRTEGWPVLAASAVTAVAALGLLAADLTVVRRLGVLVAVTAVVESMAGLWLLRPPVLGDRAQRLLAVRPVQAALRSILVPATATDQRWTGVVADLLAAEQALQTDPGGGDLERVFVPGTPLHRKATDHHAHLADAGLRVLGRDPQLRMVRVVGTSPTVIVTVTVDHPPRQLVDAQGAVLGVRKPERRSVMLWLDSGPDGTHRIADSVELGVEPLGAADDVPGAAAVAPGAGSYGPSGLVIDPAR